MEGGEELASHTELTNFKGRKLPSVDCRIKVHRLARFVELLIHSLPFLDLMFYKHKAALCIRTFNDRPHEEIWREEMRLPGGLLCENMLPRQHRDVHYIPQ